MQRLLFGAVLLVGVQALAAPASKPAATRYEDGKIAFNVPAGLKAADATDIIAEHALDLVAQPSSPLANATLRLLWSDKTVSDTDGDSLAKTWRSARVRNRQSWGVHKNAEARSEAVQIGGHRFVRYVDEMGSRLGPTHQIMLCGALQGHLLCGVANAAIADEKHAEATLTDVLASVTLRKIP